MFGKTENATTSDSIAQLTMGTFSVDAEDADTLCEIELKSL